MQEPATREKWAKRVERWKDSGLSAKEFGAETGISARSLTWWRWHLSKGDAASKQQRRRRSKPEGPVVIGKPPTPSMMKFVEVAAAAVPREGLEVVLPSAIRICVRPDFDLTTFSRLLDVLEQRR
jgi:transposase